MFDFFRDLKFGVRTLIKNPMFAIIATISLGLGVGAVTSVYSMVSSVLIHPMPFEDAERLVTVKNIHLKNRNNTWSVSYPLFQDWQEQNDVCEQISVVSGGSYNLSGSEGPEWVRAGFITSSFFPMLRIQPVLGRNFSSEHDEFGKANVAMLSYRLWKDRFGGRDDIIGESVLLDGESFTVLGVVPAGFRFLEAGDARIWVPVAARPWAEVRGNHWLNCFARLKEGVSYEQAAASMTAISKGLAEIHPKHYTDRGVGIVPAGEENVEELRLAFLILFGAVAFVLLISCANVANLLLARVASRQREVTIRIAVGAGRGRLIRQLLTESLILALLGGAAGILFSLWGNSYIISLLPPEDARFYVEFFQFGMNGEVLAVALGSALLTALVFGLVPALQASKPDLNQTLKEGSAAAGVSSKRHRLLDALVVAEVALAVVLLIGGGLMMKSFQNLRHVDPGFEPVGLLTVPLSLPTKSYPDAERRSAFYRRLEERIAGLSGVQAVGSTTILPMSGNNSTNAIAIEGWPDPPPGTYYHAGYRSITPGFPATMGIAVLKGRAFDDNDDNPDTPVALVNEAMGRRYWPDKDPVGKRFRVGSHEREGPWITIVGLVGDIHHRGFDSKPVPEYFLPQWQTGRGSMNVVVQTRGNPTALIAPIRQIVQEIDPMQPLMQVRTMDAVIRSSVWMNRFTASLFAMLAGVALLLATVGVYGVISYSVSQRVHEIGIRMALGAQSTDIQRLVVWQGFKLTFGGVAIGLVIALAVTRLMQGLLFGVSANDPMTFGAIAALLIAVSLAASYFPARKATQVAPVTALRSE